MTVVLRILAVLFAAYAGFAGLMYLAQRWAMYPGARIEPSGQGAPPAEAEQVWLATSAGRVEAWYLPAAGQATLPGAACLVFHGNAEFIDDWPEAVRPLREDGVGVLLVEYPGFGRSEGRPTQSTILEAAVAAHDWLASRGEVDDARILALGRSLGAGVAAALSLERPLAGLVLLSPFASVSAIAWHSYRLPPALVLDRFDSKSAVVVFDGPLLIFHGRHDPVIPYWHAVQLADARPDARLVSWECGHNDCPPSWEALWSEVGRFVTALPD